MNSEDKIEVSIRWYKEEDYNAVEHLIKDLTNLFQDPFEPKWFKMYMEKRLMETVPGCFVAVCDDKGVVGSVFCDVLRDPTGSQYGYISNIMVKAECRGKGIGERLLKAAIQYLVMTGVPRIWANIREETKAMVHLFEKNKFEKKFSTYEFRTPPFGI
ncbi:MAG: GNAT family N-acetyltransferase [Promethearchaeota archaeon]